MTSGTFLRSARKGDTPEEKGRTNRVIATLVYGCFVVLAINFFKEPTRIPQESRAGRAAYSAIYVDHGKWRVHVPQDYTGATCLQGNWDTDRKSPYTMDQPAPEQDGKQPHRPMYNVYIKSAHHNPYDICYRNGTQKCIEVLNSTTHSVARSCGSCYGEPSFCLESTRTMSNYHSPGLMLEIKARHDTHQKWKSFGFLVVVVIFIVLMYRLQGKHERTWIDWMVDMVLTVLEIFNEFAVGLWHIVSNCFTSTQDMFRGNQIDAEPSAAQSTAASEKESVAETTATEEAPANVALEPSKVTSEA